MFRDMIGIKAQPISSGNVFHPLRELFCERAAGFIDMVENAEFHSFFPAKMYRPF
jgi:hypothetical protein